MDQLNTRPSWLAALLPLLAVWQYGDRCIVRGELYRMALSADAAAQSAAALRRIASMLDSEGNPSEMQREELRAIARAALSDFERVPPCAPIALFMEHEGNLH